MNTITDFVSSLFDWTGTLPDAVVPNDDDDDDNDDASVLAAKNDNVKHIKDLEYMELLESQEHFQLDASKNVCFIVVEKQEWEKGSEYFVDGGVKLYSSVPLRDFSKVAFRYEIETVSSSNDQFVHAKLSPDCGIGLVKNFGERKLIWSKKYQVIALVLHDEAAAALTNEIAYSTKPRFRKGIVYSDVTEGIRSILLNRPVNKLRDLYTPVDVYLKSNSAHRGESRFAADADSKTIDELKLQAKKHAIEDKSKLEKIKI
jgi:hypothetical protein